MFRKIIASLLFAALASPVWADDAPAAPATPTRGVAGWSSTESFFFFEGMITLDSAASAASPRVTGGIILLTTPLAFAEGMRGPLDQDIVAVTGYGAIGVYDTTHYPAVYSRPRVFAENLVAWNLWGGMTLLMARGNGDGTAAKLAQHLNVTPQVHGGLHLDYHWTF